MKTFKPRKFLIGLGTLTAIAAPVSIAVSCGSILGSNGRYDSDADGKVVIQTTWSAGGAAIEALQDVVDKYNETQKLEAGYLPVQIEHVEGGYGTIPGQIITKVKAHDTKTLPNLYIDYPTAVGMVNPYKMTYDMSSVVKREWFLDQFSKANDKISGVKKGGMYTVPLSKSTEAFAIDKPLMHYIFSELQKRKATVSADAANNPIVKEIMDQTISSADKGQIVSQWGVVTADAKPGVLTIDDKIFTTYEGLFNFINKAQKMFTAPGKPQMVGIDSPTNAIYTLSTMMTYNNDDDFLFTKNHKTGYVDYNFLQAGQKQTKTFKDAYALLENSINAQALWVGGGGAYGSTRLQQHQMGISISSSAGLHYAFSTRGASNLNKNETMFIKPINRLKEYSQADAIIDVNGVSVNRNEVTATMAQGPSINSVHITDQEDKSSMQFLKWLYRANDAKSLIDGLNPIDHFSEKSSYIVPLKGALEPTSVIGKEVAGKKYSDLTNSSLIGVKASFDTLKRENDSAKLHPDTSGFVDTPVDDSTGSIRKKIDSAIASSFNSKNNGGSANTPYSLWQKIHMQSIISQVIPDDGTLSTKYTYPNMINRNFSNINWDKYSYVDAVIESWTDGDTPNAVVTSTSGADAVKSINPGDNVSVRIAGIDTPESHAKLGELKHPVTANGATTLKGFKDDEIERVINHYKNDLHTPLAVFSKGHYNELGMDPTKKYTYWKNMFVDIQTKPNSAGEYDPNGVPFDPIETDPKNPGSFYDLRKVMVTTNEGATIPLITNSAKKEGFWGMKAGLYGIQQMPAGTKIRIATDGKKSYNRIVGSIFYGNNLSKNWSVEIVKKGLTLPFISDSSIVLDKTSILWQTGQPIADAFNNARKSRIGLFDYSSGTLTEHLKDILTIHGATSYSELINHHGNTPPGTPPTIYDYMSTRKPDSTLIRPKTERIGG